MCRRIKKLYIVSVIMTCMLMAGCESTETDGFQEISEISDDKGLSESESQEKIYVHVCGAVKNPGVYELEAGSRIYEVLELAGGITDDAVENSMNQAEILSDGQQIYVASEADVKRMEAENGVKNDGKVNINQASKEELMTLPGIGEAKAELIIRYREDTGNFNSIEEIMEIEGIKEGVFRKIENQITVS